MKTNIVLNSKFVAFAKNVTPIERNEEFAFEEGSEFPLATCKEIAVANSIEIPKSLKTKALINEFLYVELGKLKIAEGNKMSKLEAVKEIVLAGIEAGKTDEEMLVDVIQSGVKFKEANTLFTKAMQETGNRISPKERADKIFEILDEAEFAPETAEDVAEMVTELIEGDEAIADTSEKQALAVIRKWAKDNEVELPKAPKKASGGRSGGGSLLDKLYESMIGKTEFVEADIVDFVKAEKADISEGALKKYVTHAKRTFDFAVKFSA